VPRGVVHQVLRQAPQRLTVATKPARRVAEPECQVGPVLLRGRHALRHPGGEVEVVHFYGSVTCVRPREDEEILDEHLDSIKFAECLEGT
jgi:hypothetical protein